MTIAERVYQKARARTASNGNSRPVIEVGTSHATGTEPDEPLAIRHWPEPPDSRAFHGLAGEIVHFIAPHSEADPVAILLQLLIAFGNALNRGPHYQVEGDRHTLNLYGLLVGQTAAGRKGTAWGRAREVLRIADPEYVRNCITSGLSSGEGLIAHVQDPVERVETGKDSTVRTVVVDAGVTDKRRLVVETEFSKVLKVMVRDGNTLSPVLRQAWDDGDLNTLVKNSRTKATGAHISLIGHIPAFELDRLLNTTDVSNGFLNRFLIVCVRRSQSLPDGGSLDQNLLIPFGERLRVVLNFGRETTRLERDSEARILWHREYERLSNLAPGMLGAVTSRATAQVVRLSCLYAVLDGSDVVRRVHLEAALSLHSFVERSVAYLFGERLGDVTADRILNALRAHREGLSRSEIHALFSSHVHAAEIERALRMLAESGLVQQRFESTGGRRREVWCLAEKAQKA
jgi:hypothetical protein